MNLFTRNSTYYHLLKYLLFLLKHPVYSPSYCRYCLYHASHDFRIKYGLHTSHVEKWYAEVQGVRKVWNCYRKCFATIYIAEQCLENRRKRGGRAVANHRYTDKDPGAQKISSKEAIAFCLYTRCGMWVCLIQWVQTLPNLRSFRLRNF